MTGQIQRFIARPVRVGVALVCAALITAPIEAAAKTFNIKVKAGTEKIIEQMYWINRTTCIADEVPPRGKLRQEPALGTIRFHEEAQPTRQCPDVKSNKVFVLYKAGNTSGKERITIRWKPTSAPSFARTYIITVE